MYFIMDPSLSLFFPTRSTGLNHGSLPDFRRLPRRLCWKFPKKVRPHAFSLSSRAKRCGVVHWSIFCWEFFPWGEKVVGILEGWLNNILLYSLLETTKKHGCKRWCFFSRLFCGLQLGSEPVFRRITEKKKHSHVYIFWMFSYIWLRWWWGNAWFTCF